MKLKQFLKSIIATFVITAMFFACKATSEDSTKTEKTLTRVTISGETTISATGSTTLTATPTFSEDSANETVTYTWGIFEGTDYASISSNGNTAILTGKNTTLKEHSVVVQVIAKYNESEVFSTYTVGIESAEEIVYTMGDDTVVIKTDETATVTASDGTVTNATVSTSSDGTVTIFDSKGETLYTATTTEDGTIDTSTVKDSNGKSVEASTVSSITIKKIPTTTEYMIGDFLDLSGLVITVKYSDSSTEDVAYSSENASAFTKTGFDSSEVTEKQTVTITYKGKSANFSVRINEQPENYQTINVDLAYCDNTDLGWYPTFTMTGSDFAMLDGADNVKITFTVTGDEGASYFQVGVQYGNGSFGSWGVYDGKIYDEEGNTISVNDSGIFQNISTFVLKPETEQITSLLDRGLILQGDNATLTSVKIEYVGDAYSVKRDYTNFSNLTGTFYGGGELLSDPDNENITAWTIESSGENINSRFIFTDTLDFSNKSSVVLNARTSYDYVNGSTLQGDVYLVYNIYTWEVSDGTVKSGETTIPQGVLYNSYNRNAIIYIKDVWSNYTGDATDYAYGKGKNELNVTDDNASVATGSFWADYCMGYVYSDSACENKIVVSTYNYQTVTYDNLQIALFTDTDTGKVSSIYYDGSFSVDYADITINFTDLTQTGSTGAVDFSKIRGIIISTNLSTGTLYIKNITFK